VVFDSPEFAYYLSQEILSTFQYPESSWNISEMFACVILTYCDRRKVEPLDGKFFSAWSPARAAHICSIYWIFESITSEAVLSLFNT
jgi:hypothetical protein